MESTLFDIYLTGRLATGLTAADATQRLAQLFRTSAETAATLLTGKPQLIKRGVDQATAFKYRDALQRAGLEIDIREENGRGPEIREPVTAANTGETAAASNELTLAPPGTELLAPTERHPFTAANVDTTHISLAPQLFTPQVPTAPSSQSATANIVAPDLTLAPADGELLRPEEKTAPPAITPEVPELTLAEPGALLETLANDVVPVTPDISELSLAPAGGDLLRPEEQPMKAAPRVPDISHLRLCE